MQQHTNAAFYDGENDDATFFRNIAIEMCRSIDVGTVTSLSFGLGKKYRDVFRGSVAVTWLLTHNYAFNRQDAIRLGSRLIQDGWIMNVKRPGLGMRDKDKVLYRFTPELKAELEGRGTSAQQAYRKMSRQRLIHQPSFQFQSPLASPVDGNHAMRLPVNENVSGERSDDTGSEVDVVQAMEPDILLSTPPHTTPNAPGIPLSGVTRGTSTLHTLPSSILATTTTAATAGLDNANENRDDGEGGVTVTTPVPLQSSLTSCSFKEHPVHCDCAALGHRLTLLRATTTSNTVVLRQVSKSLRDMQQHAHRDHSTVFLRWLVHSDGVDVNRIHAKLSQSQLLRHITPAHLMSLCVMLRLSLILCGFVMIVNGLLTASRVLLFQETLLSALLHTVIAMVVAVWLSWDYARYCQRYEHVGILSGISVDSSDSDDTGYSDSDEHNTDSENDDDDDVISNSGSGVEKKPIHINRPTSNGDTRLKSRCSSAKEHDRVERKLSGVRRRLRQRFHVNTDETAATHNTTTTVNQKRRQSK